MLWLQMGRSDISCPSRIQAEGIGGQRKLKLFGIV